MNDNLVTVDLILETLQKWVEEKQPIGPSTWLDACMKMTVLVSDEHNKLFLLEQKLAEKKLNYIKNFGDKVNMATLKVEASDEYVEARNQKAKIDQIEELVRISKIQAKISDSNSKGYN